MTISALPSAFKAVASAATRSGGAAGSAAIGTGSVLKGTTAD
jgi:hypothetical protein